jgi:hypothetical protein
MQTAKIICELPIVREIVMREFTAHFQLICAHFRLAAKIVFLELADAESSPAYR